MWKIVQSSEQPLEIDETLSSKYVYIRKDIEQIEVSSNSEIISMWQYREKKVLKSDWEMYKTVMENQSATTDLELAVCDLYEMITGGN